MTPRPIYLGAVRRAAEAATPGRWYEWLAYKKIADNGNLIAAVAPGHQIRTDAPGGTMPSADMRHICQSHPDTVRRIVAALEEVDAMPMADDRRAAFSDILARHGIVLGEAPR